MWRAYFLQAHNMAMIWQLIIESVTDKSVINKSVTV